MSDYAKCIACRIARLAHPRVVTVGITHVLDSDVEEGVVRRDRGGREGDMPSRADRRRLRREMHANHGFGWLRYRGWPLVQR